MAFLFAVIHCTVGNIVGIATTSNLLWVLFLPCSFIASMSEFAGWDMLSVVFEIGSILLMTAIFYPIAMILERKEQNPS